MDSLSIFCIVLGILTIVGRGPLIFAPSATLRAYDRLFISTNTRLRAFAVVIAALAMTLLLLPFGDGSLAVFLHAVGWVMAVVALGILVFPDVVRRFVRNIFSFVENAAGDAVVRVLGLLAVVLGFALVYIGIYVV